MEDLIQQWKTNAKTDFKENLAFLNKLKSETNKNDLITKLKVAHDDVFEKIDCVKCANCCKTAPPILNSEDISRLAKYMNISKKSFIKHHVFEDLTGEYTMNGVPCAFLEDDGKCNVYDIRPQSCRRFPHTDEKEYIYRGKLNANNTVVCPAAFHILVKLKDTKSVE